MTAVGSSGSTPPPERPFDQHSSSCQDHNTMVYDDEYIGECQCRPSEDVKPPNAYELWWCEWCGEEAHEGSDPCQRCGEPATIRKYIAVDRIQAALACKGGPDETADDALARLMDLLQPVSSEPMCEICGDESSMFAGGVWICDACDDEHRAEAP